MAMLAERRRKQKWTLNPRGNDWSDDSGKFGQKMLEKMGWSSGKGLGLNENGMIEHVKISYKNDSRGMGFKESNDQWTQHEDQFSNLLKSLSNSAEPVEGSVKPTKIQSLEKKSQRSRARVHYHKFTRGKDLSRYSEKDLANIFGRKELAKKKTDENANSDAEENKSSHLIEAGSMADYFKKKIPNFGVQNGMRVGKNGVLEKVESESDDERPSFGFGFRQNIGNNFDSTNGLYAGFTKSIKTEDDNETPEDGFVPQVAEENMQRKKKSKKNVESNFNLTKGLYATFTKSIKTEEDNETSEKKEDIPFVEKSSEIMQKKKKKSKKIDDLTKSIKTEGDNENPNEEVTTKKRKKAKKSDFVSYNPDEKIKIEENPYEVKPKKKKSKKHKENDCGIANSCFEDSDLIANETIPMEENPYEIKPKKSKKKRKSEEAGLDNVCFDESIDDNEIKPKKKKSKKNKQAQETNIGVDNLALDINDICDDLMLNITDVEPVYDSPSPSILQPKQSSLKRKKSVRFSNTNQEHIIPNNEDNKLAEMMQENGFVNTAFNPTSLDTGFFDPSLEKKSEKNGISNPGFNNVQENVELIKEQINTYQAEVENDLNEAKIVNYEEILIGETGASMRTGPVKDGVRLCFEKANFHKYYIDYFKSEKPGTPKRSYKHLIKGDIILKFNNTNLHEVSGYGIKCVRETLV